MNLIYKKSHRDVDRCGVREVCLEKDGKIYGKCKIYGEFDRDTCYVSISIDEKYQGFGYSRLMWRYMFDNCLSEYPIRYDQLFFIDADASDGYWDHIGFVSNRYGYDYNGKRDLEGKGYEKVITFRNFYLH